MKINVKNTQNFQKSILDLVKIWFRIIFNHFRKEKGVQ